MLHVCMQRNELILAALVLISLATLQGVHAQLETWMTSIVDVVEEVVGILSRAGRVLSEAGSAATDASRKAMDDLENVITTKMVGATVDDVNTLKGSLQKQPAGIALGDEAAMRQYASLYNQVQARLDTLATTIARQSDVGVRLKNFAQTGDVSGLPGLADEIKRINPNVKTEGLPPDAMYALQTKFKNTPTGEKGLRDFYKRVGLDKDGYPPNKLAWVRRNWKYFAAVSSFALGAFFLGSQIKDIVDKEKQGSGGGSDSDDGGGSWSGKRIAMCACVSIIVVLVCASLGVALYFAMSAS